MKHLGKHLLSFVLVLSLVFGTTMTAFASTTENATDLQTNFTAELSNDDVSIARSAGLAWGPVTIGNIKLYMTNMHTGYVPGFSGQVAHINFHADNVDTGKAILNYHIVKYTSGSSDCLYVYDSVSKKVIINSCFRNWTDAVSAVVESVKNVVKSIVSEADWLAQIAIWAVVIVVLADLIIPADPVPILPFSINPPISEYSMSENGKLSAA